MQKNFFHNYQTLSEKKNSINTVLPNYNAPKINVDVNKLLNRVRIEKKNEQKKQIIFYSSTILMLFTLTFIIFD
ncbi:hypothetical protein N9S20_01640 [Candidatus Pelagibacter sp.]|nr:hypothetical protein [Candidatus Pelagibacter sp.]